MLLVGVGVAAWRVYAEPWKADVTLVVGGWNLLNLILAGCALGVVSERRERSSTRRVRVNRRCEFGRKGSWLPATIEDVSVNGARVRVHGKDVQALIADGQANIRFTPLSGGGPAVLPVVIRNSVGEGDTFAVGCQYVRSRPEHHRLVADLIFANADQWTQFQQARRRNPGVLVGTLWFLRLALYQTWRGLVYLVRGVRAAEERPPAAARGAQA